MRVLEDDLHLPPQRAQLALRHPRDLAPVELDASVCRLHEPEERAAERRLPAPGLADEAEDLALAEVERHVVDRLDVAGLAPHQALSEAPADRVVRLQASDRDERRSRSVAFQASSATAISSRSSSDVPPSGISSSGPCSQQSTLRASLERLLHRISRRADDHRVGAAGVEAASGRRVDQVGRRARDRVELGRVERDRSSAGARACTDARVREDVPRLALLGDLARVHHGHAVAGLGDDPEVVRDQEERGPEVLAEVGQDAQDLRLDDHVERGRRLVRDEELRAQHERERDHDPLAHAARELVRVLPEARRRDAHPPERLQRALADLAVA